MLSKNYGGVIWTNHALKRLTERGLAQKLAWTAFQYPQSSTPLDHSGTTEYKKSFAESVVTVIAKKNDRNQWLIVSCWIDPPVPGTVDAKRKLWYQRYRKSGFLKKFLLGFYSALTGRDY